MDSAKRVTTKTNMKAKPILNKISFVVAGAMSGDFSSFGEK
jgi:hypothetical protein